jgi:hypothetical protein
MGQKILWVSLFGHIEINSQITMLLAMILVPLEISPQWVGVHWYDFIMYKPMVQELLNIEQIFVKIQ